MEPSFLKTVPFLENLSDQELADLASRFEVNVISSGEKILQEGNPMDSLYVVVNGVVHVRRDSEGKDVLLARIAKSGFFGEVNLFSAGEASASIIAMDNVRIGKIPYDSCREFMESNPAAGYQIVSYLFTELAHRLKKTNDRLVNTVFWSE